MKPGYKTTEFWLVVVTSVVTIAVAAGYITADQGQQVKDATAQIIDAAIKLVATLAPVILTTVYTQSRAKVKEIK